MYLTKSPIFGSPNYDFNDETTTATFDDLNEEAKAETGGEDLTQMAFWYMVVLVVMLTSWLLVFFLLRLIAFSNCLFLIKNIF
jgi:hypothetical protein